VPLDPFMYLWDDAELPFGDPPSRACPTVETLELSVQTNRCIHWNYRGMTAAIPVATIRNALAEWDAYRRQQPRREPVPRSVGKFTWGQTIPLDEVDELGEAKTAPEAPRRREPHRKEA
jgi:hypothetical protein